MGRKVKTHTSPRDVEIISLVEAHFSIQEVGNAYGLTRQRISQICHKTNVRRDKFADRALSDRTIAARAKLPAKLAVKAQTKALCKAQRKGLVLEWVACREAGWTWAQIAHFAERKAPSVLRACLRLRPDLRTKPYQKRPKSPC